MARRKSYGNKQSGKKTDGRYWMYGLHAVQAALLNEDRRKFRLLLTEEASHKLERFDASSLDIKMTDRKEIDSILPKGAVHQGIILQVEGLSNLHPEDIMKQASRVLILDQVTDPHNIGAILRSAAAFHIDAVFVQDKHSPSENAIIAKSASGGLEHVPLISVVNLSRLIEQLKQYDFWVAAFDSEAEETLNNESLKVEKAALVFGAEGKGIRPLVLEKCDMLMRLPTLPPIASLNISNAVAIALYASR